jgi:RecB family exonuclease
MTLFFDKWSAGKLSLFKACPFAFYCQEILKLAQLPSTAAEVGSAVHSALETIFQAMLNNDRKPLAKKDVTKLITSACFEMLTYGLHPKKDITDISNMVKYALTQMDLRNFEGVGIGKWFEIPLDKEGHVVRGKIDLELMMSGGMPYVIDFKTGTESTSHGDLQLLTYALAQWSRGYRNDVLGGLFFLRQKDLKPTLITQDQIMGILSLYREAAQDVEKRLVIGESAFDARPCYRCEYCSFSGLCPKVKKLGEFPATVEDMTPERAKELAEWLLVTERSVALIRELMKGYAELQDNGFYEVNGGYFGKKPKLSREWNLGDVLDTLEKLEIDDTVFRNISLSSLDVKSYLTAKKYAKTSLRDELENKAKIVTRNYFDYYKALPEKKEDDDLQESENESAA